MVWLSTYMDSIGVTNVFLQAFLTLVLFFTLSKLAVIISEKIFLKLASKTETKVDDLIVEKTKNPISILLLIIGSIIAVQQLGMKESIEDMVVKILVSSVIFMVGIIAIRVFNIFVEEWGNKLAARSKSTTDDSIVILLHRTITIVILILAFLYILSYWGVEIGPMLASLGVAGIAVAFALQTTLGNIFGGISMIIDKSISVGDVVQLDAKTSGTVTDVGLRSTKIRTWDNEIVIIPNGQLANQNIHNVALPDPMVRVQVNFGVAYGSDVVHVRKIVMKEIKNIDAVLSEPAIIVRFQEMGDSALLFRCYFWVGDHMKRIGAKEEATERIYNILNKEKIGIPFPQMDVYIKEHKK